MTFSKRRSSSMRAAPLPRFGESGGDFTRNGSRGYARPKNMELVGRAFKLHGGTPAQHIIVYWVMSLSSRLADDPLVGLMSLARNHTESAINQAATAFEADAEWMSL